MKKYAFILATATLVFTQPALAQFNPGKEAAGSGGGPATQLTIKNTAPGQAILTVTDVNAVYLNDIPKNVKAHFSDKDASGKGTAYVVEVASNPALANTTLCWRGVGSDWGTKTCGPIKDGRAEIAIDVGQARDTAFALVPVLMDGSKQVAWAAHPENSRVQLPCPRMDNTDTASVFSVDGDGAISIADPAAVKAYEPHYATFCQR